MRAALDKIRGCLLGGAAGDALGYPVEFLSARGMKVRYGEEGITEYSLRQGIAVISDDTQMSLFTANGLLCARRALDRRMKRKEELEQERKQLIFDAQAEVDRLFERYRAMRSA